MQDLCEEYCRQAEECRKKAVEASHPSERAEWLRLTDVWLRMAGEATPAKSVPGVPDPRRTGSGNE